MFTPVVGRTTGTVVRCRGVIRGIRIVPENEIATKAIRIDLKERR